MPNSADPKTIEFQFEHKVFSVEGCVFRRTEDGQDIGLFVPMGDILAAITVGQLQSTFEIAPDSNDGQLLDKAVQALQYIKQLYPGDSVPIEVLDGSAFWMVEDQYLALAKARISMQLIAWHTGEATGEIDAHQIVELSEDPENIKLLEKAYVAMAEKLDYPADKKQDLIDLAGKLAQELSYVEALRDKLGRTRQFQMKLGKLFAVSEEDKNLRESITRCNTLLNNPIKQIFSMFDELDGNTGEILQTLRGYDAQIKYIREVRDEFRQICLLWEEILDQWMAFDSIDPQDIDNMIRTTYRFAASNFAQKDDWGISA